MIQIGQRVLVKDGLFCGQGGVVKEWAQGFSEDSRLEDPPKIILLVNMGPHDHWVNETDCERVE